MLANKIRNIIQQWTENFTGFLTNISGDHRYIHEGKAFTAIINTGSISAAYRIGFTTPTVASGKYVHYRPIGITTSANYVDVVLTEADSFSSGSTVTPFNRNRNSATTSSMQTFSSGVTSTPAGTVVDRIGIGTAGNPVALAGGGRGSEHELVLKPNTSYVYTLTPSGATTVNFTMFWYEEGTGV